jgi:Gpi18-like mannosyltransferase
MRTLGRAVSWLLVVAMSLVRRHPLWVIGLVGVGIRLVLAFAFFGNGDLFAFGVYARRTLDDPLHTYAGNASGLWWPYPPVYLVWLVGALKLAEGTGLPFHGTVQLLPILADLALAAAVYVYLGWRGAEARSRVFAFALVMLGPVFIAISGYHGQIDAVAILPGVLALMLWERRSGSARALESGLLVGLGGAIKTVPMLLIVPLLASARSMREGAKLVASAVAVVVVTCLPFCLAEPSGFEVALRYNGVPGRGGLSLLADPVYAADRRVSVAVAFSGEPNGLARWLTDNSGPITIVVLLALLVFLRRYRPEPIIGIVLLWLAVFVFSPNFLSQYLIWALPFAIMAGYLRETGALQVAMIPTLVLTYLNTSATTRALAVAYVVMMICLWAFWVAALITVLRRVIRGRDSIDERARVPVEAEQSA